MKTKPVYVIFAIQNNKGKWYGELGVEENWDWNDNFDRALLFTIKDCAEYRVKRFTQDYPSQPTPKIVKFECYQIQQIKVTPTGNNKRNAIGKCKFCGASGFKSDQGGIDGVAEWEVYAAHKKSCPVRQKGHLQGEVTWVPINDWDNFYVDWKIA